MTEQTEYAHSLVGSPAGSRTSRLRTLTAVAFLAIGAISGFGQEPQAVQSEKAKPAAEQKSVPEAKEKVVGNYTMHSNVELGGVITQRDGSRSMWSTMVNEGTGMRVLSQSLELRTTNPSKTPFFDRLSTSSFGYGGEPNDVSYLKMSKGKLWDFSGSFRRDRNYFDYNLLDNSLLSTATAANPVLIPEPSSLHIFNTVRRNTDALFTLFPVSLFSFRIGYNHNTHEGPTYSTIHGGGDVVVMQYFRNSLDTYTAGVDYKLAKRTTLSYDQFFGFYRGDSYYQLAPTPFTLANGTPSSVGVNTLSATTCGTGANKTAEVVNGIINPYCSQTLVQSQVAPTRTTFPTEQLRFTSHYWDKLAFNGRVAYSGDVSNVNHFNETFNGLLARTFLRQEIDTGGFANGRLAHNKRSSLNGDFSAEAELSKYFAVSDSVDLRYFRTAGSDILVSQIWAGTDATHPANLNVNTPLSSLTEVTETTPGGDTINQKIWRNTLLGIFTPVPQVRFSAGWRFDNRHITDTDDNLSWHQNGIVAGLAATPSRAVRINLNLDTLRWKSATTTTESNTYTREAPDKVYHVRARATITPAKWINFAVAGSDFQGKNTDPLINHLEQSRDLSFSTQIIPSEKISVDLTYAHDSVFSETDLCYVFTPNANYGVPNGAVNRAGTCQYTTLAAATPVYLGNGFYDAPVNFFNGAVSLAPSKYLHINGGIRFTNTNGSAEFLNPLMVPGALQSKVVSPFSDVLINIAPQWAWHGNWVHHGYNEAGGPGPAPRDFRGDVVTLGVKYAF